MKSAALLLALLALPSSAQGRFDRVNSRTEQGRSDRGFMSSSLPLFSAFDGAGTTTACSTTAPTGAKGEVATVVRATSATCQSTAAGGMASTGISNGELSTVASGVLRQEYDRNGVLGARVESQRTNSTPRAQELENIVWASNNSGVALPTVTADQAVAPDGTATADRVQIPAVAGAQYSQLYQLSSCPAGASNQQASFFAKGVSGAGTYYVKIGASTCVACSYVAGAYTRCQPSLSAVASLTLTLANDAATCGANGAIDAYIWGADCENSTGGKSSSYIPTAGAAAQRNADVVSFPVTLSGSTFSAAISYDAPSVLASGATAFQVYVDANNSVTATVDASSKLVCTFRIGGVDSTVTSAAALTASAVNRVACQYGASGRSACLGGTCTTTAGALTIPTGAATYYGGTRSAAGNECNGIVSRWCYDQADARCI